MRKAPANEVGAAIELAQWVASCTCKIIREKLKVDSWTNQIDMYDIVYDQRDKLESKDLIDRNT